MQKVKEGDHVLIAYNACVLETDALNKGCIVARDSGQIRLRAGDRGAIGAIDAVLVGMGVGKKKALSVPPAEAFGARDSALVQELPRSLFRSHPNLKAGSLLRLASKNGKTIEVVTRSVNDKTVIVDANHPLAGMTLNLELTVIKIEARK